MKLTLKFIILIALSFCSAKSAQAFETIYDPSDFPSVSQMITNEQGMFLLIDDIWIGTEGIQMTSDGLLVLVDRTWVPLQEALRCGVYLWWKCPNKACGKYNPQNVRYCLYCGTDRFS